jgi:hypothetical protein
MKLYDRYVDKIIQLLEWIIKLYFSCTQIMYNWILKQVFYFKYLILKQDLSVCGTIWKLLQPQKITFQSKSFTDGQFNAFLPWYKDSKAFQDWNTYGIFSQQYGKFYFKAKLDGLVTKSSWPAIWLLDMCSQNDINEGRGDHPYYYEVDIELMRNHLIYSIHFSHNGEKAFETILRSQFANRRLRRNLQKDYHLFLIDWSQKWIRFYINGILSARFRNEIHTPLQIICSKIDATKIIVQK